MAQTKVTKIFRDMKRRTMMKGMFCPQCIREGQVTEHWRRCFQYLSILYMLLTLLGAPRTSESAVLHYLGSPARPYTILKPCSLEPAATKIGRAHV